MPKTIHMAEYFPSPPFSVNQKKFFILHSSIQNRSTNNTTHTPNSPLKSHHSIIHGDSRQMNLLADRSVHLVVTSPPYWQLKDYGTKNQIGFHESYESYINNLNLVWNECERATLQSPPKSRKRSQP
jgi:tRNA1(Val) A37 N6-methylase TrmN6